MWTPWTCAPHGPVWAGLWDVHPGERSFILGPVPDGFTEGLSQFTHAPAVHKISHLFTSSALTVNYLPIFQTKKIIQRINTSRSCFFEKINKIDKPLTRLIKKKREKIQINKIRNESGEVTTETTERQRSVRNYSEQPNAKKLDNLGEMDKLLKTCALPKLNREEAGSLNRPLTRANVKQKSKNSQHRKALDQMASQVNFTDI